MSKKVHSMRKNPTISIVTVVWNNLEGLKITAASIATQIGAQIEHIVVDGASQDGTVEWLKKYEPSYPTLLISEPDDGLYDAMNKGLRMATGDLVLFLNGGDSFCSSDILGFVSDEWRNSDWQWAYGGINYIDSNRNVLSDFKLVPFQARRVQLGLTYIPHPATFMSRDLLSQLQGFRPEFGWSADQELGVRAALIEAPHVWSRSLTDFLVGGAHSQGSLADVARRYAKIRHANGLEFLGSSVLDSLYTNLIGTYWSTRASLSRRLKSRSGVDSVRTL